MNYFTVKILATLVLIVGGAMGAGYFIGDGMWPQALLIIIVTLIPIFILLSLIDKLKGIVSTFLQSIEAGDTSLSFEIKGDPGLLAMSQAMDRIAGVYRSALMETRTRKMYYDRILRVITHEIRNDLSPIISLSKEMSQSPSSFTQNEMSEAMGIIAFQSHELKRFLDSYYELTHIPEPVIENVDINGFMKSLISINETTAKSKGLPAGTLKYVTPIDMQAQFDPNLLSRALGNIIRNALDAVVGVESPEVMVSASVSEGVPFFTISDNGPGLSEKAKENLFTPFFSTKEGGSGIGLSLSRQIVRLHKGDINVTSNPDRGTTVTISLG